MKLVNVKICVIKLYDGIDFFLLSSYKKFRTRISIFLKNLDYSFTYLNNRHYIPLYFFTYSSNFKLIDAKLMRGLKRVTIQRGSVNNTDVQK